MKVVLVLAFAFVAATNLANAHWRPLRNLLKRQDLDPRIVGGREAENGEFPYQISFRIRGYHACGGSILDELHILSAAHCFFDWMNRPINVSSISIVAGTNHQENPENSAQIINAESYQVNEKYDPNGLDHDVGVIKLKEPLTFNEKVQPIRLAESDPAEGVVCTVSGWGYLKENQEVVPDELYAVNVTSITRNTCSELYDADGFPGVILEDMICFIDSGKDSCQGDSGGPMACDGVLSGVVSFGDGCARPKVPGVYASVSFYRDWILSQLK